MIGKNAGNCLYDHRKYFGKVMHSWQPQDASMLPMVKSRALWKEENCDTESIVEDNVQKKSVKKKYREESVRRKFAQCYMQSAWKDFEFINSLKTNIVLQSSNQNSESFNIINREIDDCVEKTGMLIVCYSWKLPCEKIPTTRKNNVNSIHSNNCMPAAHSTLTTNECSPIRSIRIKQTKPPHFVCNIKHVAICSGPWMKCLSVERRVN